MNQAPHNTKYNIPLLYESDTKVNKVKDYKNALNIGMKNVRKMP